MASIIGSCGKSYEKKGRKVEVIEENGKYLLYRNGKPYFIKGAGAYDHFDELKNCGGNSIRTWDAWYAKEILDKADSAGITVTLGLHVQRERQGFDYNDEKAVIEQLESLRTIVREHKDHPALLMWAVGNEVNQLGSNDKVWDAVNDIAKMIHEEDPDHPVTTMIVPERETILTIKRKCPELDILSFNTFMDLKNLPSKLDEWVFGWDGPYIVSEWGSKGWWEVQRTSWDAAVEPSSTVKAFLYKEMYKYIKKDQGKCIGSYVFYWGWKQERTPTWFSMFTEDGKETAAIEVMRQLWTENAQLENHAPVLKTLSFAGKKAEDNIFIKSGTTFEAIAEVKDPDGDTLQWHWEILEESKDLNGGGDYEEKPQKMTEAINFTAGKALVNMPSVTGPYRLYFYAWDKKGKTVTANVPFYVMP